MRRYRQNATEGQSYEIMDNNIHGISMYLINNKIKK